MISVISLLNKYIELVRIFPPSLLLPLNVNLVLDREMLPKIIRKRLRKRIVTIQAELLNEARQVELAIRMEDDPEAVFPKKGPLNPKNLSGDFQENDFSRVSVSGKNPSKKITRLHGAENDGTKLAAE